MTPAPDPPIAPEWAHLRSWVRDGVRCYGAPLEPLDVPVSAPAPVAVPSRAPRPRQTPRAAVRAPEPPREPDTDIPFTPLPDGALVDMLVSSGQVSVETLPPGERAAWESRQAARADPVAVAPPDSRTDAAWAASVLLTSGRAAIERALSDKAATATEIRALADMMFKLSGGYDAPPAAGPDRPVRDLSRAELLAIIEQERGAAV